MLLFARCGVRDAQQLCAKRPRRDGEGGQGGRDLRVLLIGLRVHAGRGGRRVGAHWSTHTERSVGKASAEARRAKVDACPPFKTPLLMDGGHGASAPLPTLVLARR